MPAEKPTKKTSRFRPTKKLGQHFLKDPQMIQEIITRARFEEDAEVLEVGPGMGALTFPLAGRVKRVIAVEKDGRLVEMLKKSLTMRGIHNVTVLSGDILRLDFSNVIQPQGNRMDVIGNLPYNISSPFLEKLFENRALVKRAVLTFQIEFAERLAAMPCHKEYGAMTVMVQYHAHVAPLLEIPRDAFYPRPNVGSMVLEIDLSRPYPARAPDEDLFRKVVKAAFAQRRKTIINSLKGTLTSLAQERIRQSLSECGIDPRRRAETLGMDDFLCLSTQLALNPPPNSQSESGARASSNS